MINCGVMLDFLKNLGILSKIEKKNITIGKYYNNQ